MHVLLQRCGEGQHNVIASPPPPPLHGNEANNVIHNKCRAVWHEHEQVESTLVNSHVGRILQAFTYMYMA